MEARISGRSTDDVSAAGDKLGGIGHVSGGDERLKICSVEISRVGEVQASYNLDRQVVVSEGLDDVWGTRAWVV